MSKPVTDTIVQLRPNGEPAPHDNHGNPTIVIDVLKETCHARPLEHASKRSVQGKVIFSANENHKLYFSNREVFKRTDVDLINGEVKLDVQTDLGETEYCLIPFPHQHDKELEDQKHDKRLGDPKLVIP